MPLPRYKDLAPDRLSTAKLFELIGEDKKAPGQSVPFAIVQLSGVAEDITYTGTGTAGKVMNGTVQRVDREGEPTGDTIPVVFTGSAVVNGLEEICQNGFQPFLTALKKVSRPGQQPMWMLQ